MQSDRPLCAEPERVRKIFLKLYLLDGADPLADLGDGGGWIHIDSVGARSLNKDLHACYRARWG